MFVKSDIRKISLVITKKHYNGLIYELGNREYVHFSEVDDERAVLKRKPEKDGEKDSMYAFISARNFLQEYDPETLEEFDYELYLRNEEKLFSRRLDDDVRFINDVQAKKEQYESLKSRIDGAIREIDEKKNDLMKLMKSGIDIEGLKSMKLCTVIWGETDRMVTADDLRECAGSYLVSAGPYTVCVVLEKEREHVMGILSRYGFRDRSDMLTGGEKLRNEIRRLEKRRGDLEKRSVRVEERFRSLLGTWIPSMAEIYGSYTVLLRIRGAREKHLVSEEVLVVSGWVDHDDVSALKKLLHEICGESYFLHVSSKKERWMFRRQAPVNLRNNFLFRPFELLVRNLGMPGNNEADPTPLTAFSFVLMFGVMFGDAGQGLVLVSAGFILRHIGGRRMERRPALVDGGGILIACGISAAIFGLLYGSIFSNEHIIPALWFHPMEHMMELFLATIVMGALLITVAVLMNIVNGIIAGRWDQSLLDTKGLPGLVVYIILVFIAVRFVREGILPTREELALWLGFPVGIFIMRNVILYPFQVHDRLFPHGIFEYIVETAVELIEMFSGFLSNTISFVRAGAFALSHAGLSIAIYTLAGIINPEMSGPAVYLVLIFGNIFIILLEGLVCGIQSMRLEYYEFFSRFFQGDGTPFEPFSLRK